MLLKIYCFGILLSIMTLIFVRIDLKLFKLKYNTPDTTFELEIEIVFEDLWAIFIPIYNVFTAFYLFYQVSRLKAAILEDIGYKKEE